MLKLANSALELVIAPEVGGSIARFDYIHERGRIAILRGCDGMPGNVLDAASFPLVPYVNRIRGGRFQFRSRDVQLAPNMEGDPSPLHGQGWLAAWDVIESSDTRAELRFFHEAGEWPWRYEARQFFRLSESGLSVELCCRNLSDEPMPCGLGQHPYFPCDATTRLSTGVTDVWTIDQRVLPVEKVAAAGRYDLADRAVCGQGLDHGFEGWNGTAKIDHGGWPFGVEMSSPDARFFQLYSPSSGGLFVAEPVTHRNAALNEPEASWPATGLRVLEPGEDMSLTMRVALVSAE